MDRLYPKLICGLLLAIAMYLGCGGTGRPAQQTTTVPATPDQLPDTPPPPPPVVGSGTLPIMPTRAVVTFGTTTQFTSKTAVTWSVDGVAGGNSTVGTISSAGVYVPPAVVGQHTVTGTSQADASQTGNATVWVSNSGPIVTHKFNTYRTGQNINETVLTPENVNSSTFGKLVSYPVDGLVYAQPLYVPNLSIAAGNHNVVFAATEHDSVYAFDADGRQNSPLWKASLINPSAGITTVPTPPGGDGVDAVEIGITSTPVIDLSSNTMYVVANTQVNGSAQYRLHALDIQTGKEKLGGPVAISGSVSGTGSDSSGGVLAFNAVKHLQRPALLLANGNIYIGFASYGDFTPYHGWLFVYSASTLTRVGVFCATPNGSDGGIWMAGGGPAADSSGAVYLSTGNGTFSVQNGGSAYGDSVIKFGPASLTVADWFSPFDNEVLDQRDFDLGSGGPLLLPDATAGSNLLVIGGKAGTLYLLNRDHLGHWQSGSDSEIVQAIPNASTGEIFGTPVWWNGWVYVGSLDDHIKAFQLQNGKLSTSPTSATSTLFEDPGAPAPSISANGDSHGILWALQYGGTGSEVLHAWDATDLTHQLYASTQVGSRDDVGRGVKFTVPVVADGKVFVGTHETLKIFGLLPK